MRRVLIQQPADHLLILRIMLSGLVFKKVYAGFAESDRNLDGLIFQRKLFG